MLEIQKILKDYSADRPTMSRHNTLEALQSLLRGEMTEFEESPSPMELSDVIIYALTIANLMEWNMEEEVRTKIAFNNARFVPGDFQEGSYEEARIKGKDREKEVKHLFYD